MNQTLFFKRLQALPNGAYDVTHNNKRYLLTKHTLLKGKLIKVYAKELGGNDIVSANYYATIKKGTLKPCEMSEKKVIDFILGLDDEPPKQHLSNRKDIKTPQ